MIIGIDFDGVLIKHKGIPRSHKKGFFQDPPVKDALQAVRWLIKEGHDIYILTGREEDEWDYIKDWLKKWGFPELEVTNIKRIKTHLIIDDRCLRFTNWQDVCKLIG